MCLIINHSTTKKFKNRKDAASKIYVYKVLDMENGKLITPYQGVKINSGWFKADVPDSYDEFTSEIYGGIHVFKNRKLAEEYTHKFSVAIRCWAYRRDLIAVGDRGDLAFKKIFVPKKELDAAIDVLNGV